MKSAIKAIAAATLVLCGTNAALASAVFTDRTAFMAAVSGTSNEAYNCNCSPDGFVFLNTVVNSIITNVAVYNGVTYTNIGSGTQNDFLIASDFYAGANQNVSGTDFFQAETSAMTLTFGSGQMAIGFDVNNLFGAYDYTLSVGSLSVSLSGAMKQSGFIGILADTAFTTALLTNAGTAGFLDIDNLTTMAAPATVPEPASLALVVGALGMLGIARRRSSTA